MLLSKTWYNSVMKRTPFCAKSCKPYGLHPICIFHWGKGMQKTMDSKHNMFTSLGSVGKQKKARVFFCVSIEETPSRTCIFFSSLVLPWQLIITITHTISHFLSHVYSPQSQHAVVIRGCSMSTDGKWWHVAAAPALRLGALATQFALCAARSKKLLSR